MKNKFSKIILWVLVPIILLALWFGLSLAFNNDISFSVLTKQISKPNISSPQNHSLMKGQSISGSLKASENHLGLLIIKFKDFESHNYAGQDILLFKFREKGDKSWSYIADYNADLLSHNLYLTVGFPVIDNSIGKSYEFNITSLYGNPTNAVKFDRKSTQLIAGYKFSKSEILSSKKNLIKYLFKKSIYSISDPHFLLGSVLYLLPLLIYLFALLIIRRLPRGNVLPAGVVVVLIILNIFFVREVYLGILAALIFVWVFAIKFYRLESSVSYSLALFLLTIWVVLAFLKVTAWQSELNIWIFTLLVIGLVQSLFEERNTGKKYVGYKEFVRKLIKFNG